MDLDDIFNDFLQRFGELYDIEEEPDFTTYLHSTLWELIAKVLVVQRTGGTR